MVERRLQKKKCHWRGIRTRRYSSIVSTAQRPRPSEAEDGNSAAKGTDTNNENTGSLNAEIIKKIRISQVEVNVSENGKVEWILDSGCIDHIINKESYFTNYACLKNQINVKVGDGRSVRATKVGNIQINFSRKKNKY